MKITNIFLISLLILMTMLLTRIIGQPIACAENLGSRYQVSMGDGSGLAIDTYTGEIYSVRPAAGLIDRIGTIGK